MVSPRQEAYERFVDAYMGAYYAFGQELDKRMGENGALSEEDYQHLFSMWKTENDKLESFLELHVGPNETKERNELREAIINEGHSFSFTREEEGIRYSDTSHPYHQTLRRVQEKLPQFYSEVMKHEKDYCLNSNQMLSTMTTEVLRQEEQQSLYEIHSRDLYYFLKQMDAALMPTLGKAARREVVKELAADFADYHAGLKGFFQKYPERMDHILANDFLASMQLVHIQRAHPRIPLEELKMNVCAISVATRMANHLANQRRDQYFDQVEAGKDPSEDSYEEAVAQAKIFMSKFQEVLKAWQDAGLDRPKKGGQGR